MRTRPELLLMIPIGWAIALVFVVILGTPSTPATPEPFVMPAQPVPATTPQCGPWAEGSALYWWNCDEEWTAEVRYREPDGAEAVVCVAPGRAVEVTGVLLQHRTGPAPCRAMLGR